MIKNTGEQIAECFSEIEIALVNQTASKFRAKYPGSCACCGSKFRPPTEIVYKLGPGRLVCWNCVQTVRVTDDSPSGYRDRVLPDIR
jgi:hypothetical protein